MGDGMDRTRATVCLTFDFDAISLWVGTFGVATPGPVSRGEFGVVGVQRILRLLEREGVRGTFFVPGHTAETYPEATRAIVAGGHEVGHHGYLHEDPVRLGRKRERAVLERGMAALERVAGVRPVGYRSPGWDTSPETIGLLVEAGFRYDSSLMGDDYTPYWCRVGDQVQKDGPFRFGERVDLVEMPVSWALDDFPHFEYVSLGGAVRPGSAAGSKVEEIWREEFSYMYREVPGGVLTLTMHPQVIGRGHRMLMLERLIGFYKGHAGVGFATLGEAAEGFRAREAGGG